MKRIIIIISTITLLLAISSVRNAQAQTDTTANTPTPPLTNTIGSQLNWLNQPGTRELQDKVLMQINQGLVNGWLSPDQASQFKTQLNKVNDQESWYQSFRAPIPQVLMQKNIALLKEMSQKLQPKNLPSANAANSLHTDIDELISNALAKNRISSNQAEAYYLKLAQIESNLESTKTGQVSNEKTAMDKSLNQLRIELLHKVN